jgi:hypothetical protein
VLSPTPLAQLAELWRIGGVLDVQHDDAEHCTWRVLGPARRHGDLDVRGAQPERPELLVALGRDVRVRVQGLDRPVGPGHDGGVQPRTGADRR